MMHVVVGTAGHIDHGKTSLVKRLTGVDTDRLEEEKRRGMTIELGFAPLKLPSGSVVSLVDVPGHEKFIKNMVAGVTGIDLFLLVIAADEGIMPQTREHVQILRLLGVDCGVVALTKIDLVDSETISITSEMISRFLQEHGITNTPVIPVSSITGQGVDTLLSGLDQLADTGFRKSAHPLFRLPVDRVFTLQGHGTVVTGTIAGGDISSGGKVEVLPEQVTAKVRSLQVHHRSADTATAGDRCALNLGGIEKEEIGRGSVVVLPGSVSAVSILDVVIKTVDGMDRLMHNQRVHVNLGTKEVLARVRILHGEFISEGSRGYGQLRLEEPVIAIRGDHFILRSYSPVATIGGGTVLYHDSGNRKRFSDETLDALTLGEQGSLQDVIAYRMTTEERTFGMEELWQAFYANRNELQDALNQLVQEGMIVSLPEMDRYLSKNTYEGYIKKIGTEFEKLYLKYPFRFHLGKEEIRSRLFPGLDQKNFLAVLQLMIQNEDLRDAESSVAERGQEVRDKIRSNPSCRMVETILQDQKYQVWNVQALFEKTGLDTGVLVEVLRFFSQINVVADLGDGYFLQRDDLAAVALVVQQMLEKTGSVTAGQLRDELHVGRKSAIVLLEYFDTVGMTIREGDSRKPGPNHGFYKNSYRSTHILLERQED